MGTRQGSAVVSVDMAPEEDDVVAVRTVEADRPGLLLEIVVAEGATPVELHESVEVARVDLAKVRLAFRRQEARRELGGQVQVPAEVADASTAVHRPHPEDGTVLNGLLDAREQVRLGLHLAGTILGLVLPEEGLVLGSLERLDDLVGVLDLEGHGEQIAEYVISIE